MRLVLNCLVVCCLASPLTSFGQIVTEGPTPPVDRAAAEVAPVLSDWAEKAITRASSALSHAELPPVAWMDPSPDPQKTARSANNGNGSTFPATSYVFPSKGKLTLHWTKSMVGPRALIGSGLRASWNTWVSDSPKEWTKDAEGWGKRFGVSMADSGMNQTSVFLLSMAMHQDPIYYRCACSGMWPRVGHAVEMTFLSRNRYGDRVIAPPKLVSPFVGPMVTRNLIYPARYNSGDAALSGATYILGTMGWNLVREFFLKTPNW